MCIRDSFRTAPDSGSVFPRLFALAILPTGLASLQYSIPARSGFPLSLIHIWQSADWVEVLAVFAVKVAGSNDADAADVATMDADRIARLKAVFRCV